MKSASSYINEMVGDATPTIGNKVVSVPLKYVVSDTSSTLVAKAFSELKTTEYLNTLNNVL